MCVCACGCVYRQAHVCENSREDENDRCALINDSRDVRRDDAGRTSSATKSAVDRHRDDTSTSKPRRPAADEVDAVIDAVRRVSATSSNARASRGSPSAPASSMPIPMSGTGDRSPSQRYSRQVPRSPDAERWRCRADKRRPESSPSARRVSCGQTRCDRVDSVDSVRTTVARRPAVSRANTTGEYLLQVPDVVYPPRAAPIAVPTAVSSEVVETQLSSSLPERGPSAAATSSRPPSPFAQTRHAPRVYYSNSEDRVSASDAETRAIVPSLPYSPCASPGESPRLRRQPTIETRRLSVTETDEGWTQLNQYKLKDEIGKVRLKSVCFS